MEWRLCWWCPSGKGNSGHHMIAQWCCGVGETGWQTWMGSGIPICHPSGPRDSTQAIVVGEVGSRQVNQMGSLFSYDTPKSGGGKY